MCTPIKWKFQTYLLCLHMMTRMTRKTQEIEIVTKRTMKADIRTKIRIRHPSKSEKEELLGLDYGTRNQLWKCWRKQNKFVMLEMPCSKQVLLLQIYFISARKKEKRKQQIDHCFFFKLEFEEVLHALIVISSWMEVLFPETSLLD